MSIVGLPGCQSAGPGTVQAVAPASTGATARVCKALVAAVPDRVAGQGHRSVEPDPSVAAAWGDPAIVLTCGVTRPRALRPTSQCFRVDGIDWLATQHGHEVSGSQPISGSIDFTTVGRSPYVRVQVPGTYQPAADALVDLAATIMRHTRPTSPCI